MKLREAPRGQPLLALSLVLTAWIGARALLWDVAVFAPPLPMSPAGTLSIAGAIVAPETAAAVPLDSETSVAGISVPAFAGLAMLSAWPLARPMPANEPWGEPAAPHPPRPRMVMVPYAPLGVVSFADLGDVPMQSAFASRVAWTAGVQERAPVPYSFTLPVPAEGAAMDYREEHEPQRSRAKRWSTDSWLLLRRGGEGALAAGAAPATYGASQAGGILRYRLSPEDRHRPTAYLRTTAALSGLGEREMAIGFSARPLADVPVVTAAELRATSQPWGTSLRPSVMAVTELPPVQLPRRLRGEAYLQGGYVGGEFSTPFIDGQLRVDGSVATLGRTELRAGLGGWGGAQKGASRLDIGPTATMGMGLGESGSARVGVDWRFRIGGDAAPSSGPALTLSAGF